MAGKLEITLIKSLNGATQRQKLTVRSLGLRKLHQKVIVDDTPVFRGMVKKIPHLLKVKELS